MCPNLQAPTATKTATIQLTSHAGVDAVVLAQHDLPGAGILAEQRAAVVDDEGRDRHRLQAMSQGEVQ